MGKIRNPLSFGEHFGVDSKAIEALGLLNPVLNVDTRLFIDPILLDRSALPLISNSAATRFRRFFDDVIKLLIATRHRGDVAWRAASARLSLPEVSATCLGYGAATIRGRSFGPKLRARLLDTAKQVVDLGVRDPDLFKLLPVLEEGMGPDLISDLTTNVIAPDLAQLTQSAAARLRIPISPHKIKGRLYNLPTNPLQAVPTPILLVPTDVLRPLPVAADWRGIAEAVADVLDIRARINLLIGDIWSAQVRRRKAKLRAAALRSKQAFATLLTVVEKGKIHPYRIQSDPDGLVGWIEVHQRIASDYPLDLRSPAPPSPTRATAIVDAIVARFRALVEQKGLWKMLWHRQKPHHEHVAQMLFFAVADAYCKANDLDVTPEADTGNGTVDFKFAAGYHARVLVEVKLSTNPKLVAGYERQLQTYERAQAPIASTYMVVDVGGMSRRREQSLLSARNARSGTPPQLFFVDARPQPSASKR